MSSNAASLRGYTVALLESRKSDDLAALVTRLGGRPVTAPSVREVPRPDDVGLFVDGVSSNRFDLVIFLTGVGAATLLGEADRLGQLQGVLAGLAATTIACRGPKPLAVMKRYSLTPAITTTKPHTSRELLDALSTFDMKGRPVLLVHYGERSEDLTAALRGRGARLDEACPYEWALPADTSPLITLVQDVIAERVDALIVTSQVQCRHLFQIAKTMGLAERLAESVSSNVVVAAIGPVTADALRQAGVIPDVMPAMPNMASLVTALADYFELTKSE